MMVIVVREVLNRSQNLINKRRFQRAITELESVSRDGLTGEEYGWRCILLSEAKLRLGFCDVPEIDDAIEAFRYSDTEKFAQAKYLKGWAMTLKGQWVAAKQSIQEAYSSFLRLGQLRSQARALNRLSYLALQTGNPEQSMMHLERCCELFVELGDDCQLASMLANLAVVEFRGGKIGRSLQTFRAIDLSQFGDSQKHILNYYQMSARAHAQLGDIKKARELLDKCKPYLGQFLRETGIYYENVGFVETLAGNYDAAEEALRAGLQIALDTAPESSLMVQIKRLFGDLYVARGEWDKAEQYTAEALALAEKIQERAEIAA